MGPAQVGARAKAHFCGTSASGFYEIGDAVFADGFDGVLEGGGAGPEPLEFVVGDGVMFGVAGLDIGALQEFEATPVALRLARPGVDEARVELLGQRAQELHIVGRGAVGGKDEERASVGVLDGLMKFEGGVAAIASVTETDRTDATYNLTVADFETYFVGEQRVLVHNCPTGSYTNTHESGKTYDGKGDANRAKTSADRIAKEHNDPLAKTETRSAPNDRESFKQESRSLDANGGPKSDSNYNKIESPGKEYRIQDDELKR